VGLTNRLLSRAVGRAYLTYEETAAQFGRERARVLGNPVRRAFVDAARMAQHDPAGASARSRTVLVLGGSQGARALNEIVPQALAQAGLAEFGVSVVHQTGAAMAPAVEARYRELGVQAEVVPFIDDVARAYMRASLVISRAGATIIAELCAIGRPSILVPLPSAAEDHQTRNAAALQEAGAALAIAERDLLAAPLAAHVRALLTDGSRRNAMAEAARRRGRPDAAAAIVDDLLAWLGVPSEAAPEPEATPGGDGIDTDGGASASASPELRVPIRRKPRVRRTVLRIRAVDAQEAAP
jgi:UDP-N-acetylglucosamine--N-acetylmuramyl-(pentapeptide) pyrophosphoryl-undecaprenol N-acetylglucosamine transferase